MGSDSLSVAVIGVGGSGSAACYHLARAGVRVTGYEQFAIGHDRGSSHGESRIIRYTYPDALYTAMMGDAYPLWAALEEEAGEELFVRCGGLLFGTSDHPDLIQTAEALTVNGLDYELLSPEETRTRFPAVRLAESEVALYQTGSGFLRSTRCVRAHAHLAAEHGAVLHEHSPVRDILPEPGGGVRILTEDGSREVFDRVIVTAGAWMGKLYADLNLPLSVERRQVVYLDIARHPEFFDPSRLPIWIDAEALYYGFPSDGRVPGVKLASHVLGGTVEPDADGRQPEEQPVQEALAFAARRFPDLAGPPTWTQVCLYTNTPDEDFIIDVAPGLSDVLLVSGCSGHGFKFTTLLGQIAAGWAMETPYPRDLTRFSLSRFAQGSV